jgi:hypothetical protein
MNQPLDGLVNVGRKDDSSCRNNHMKWVWDLRELSFMLRLP